MKRREFLKAAALAGTGCFQPVSAIQKDDCDFSLMETLDSEYERVLQSRMLLPPELFDGEPILEICRNLAEEVSHPCTLFKGIGEMHTNSLFPNKLRIGSNGTLIHELNQCIMQAYVNVLVATRANHF